MGTIDFEVKVVMVAMRFPSERLFGQSREITNIAYVLSHSLQFRDGRWEERRPSKMQPSADIARIEGAERQ